MQVAAVLTTGILVVNVALHRPLIDAVLFSLAIAVGISPQLLPAVVATSLATGSRRSPAAASWSSGSWASRTSATSTSSSPTRPAR